MADIHCLRYGVMSSRRSARRTVTALITLVAVIIAFSLATPALMHVSRRRTDVVSYVLSREGSAGLPAVAPLPEPVLGSTGAANGSPGIVTVTEQSPPPIPKPVSYPGSPGTVLILSQSASPQYLRSLGMKFRYVIVTSTTMLRDVIPLAVIHAAEGMNVLVTTMSWVKAHFPAKKPCDSLRAFARFTHYKLGATYLLLGGDVDVVPTAYWYSEDIFPADGENAYKATDQYYAFLDGNWDPNGNGKLLETLDTNGDNVPDEDLEPLPDSVPDLYVGRLPASTPSQMRALVNAIISYLTNPPMGSWVRRAVLIAAIANFKDELGSNIPKVDLAQVAQYIRELLLPHGYDVVRVYQSAGLEATTYPHEVNLTHSNVVKLLSEGDGLVYSGAHGIPLAQGMKVWVGDTNGNGIPDRDEIVFRYFLQVWDPIDNHGKRFLAYLDGCLTGYYDFKQDSLAEYMLRHSAIAVIASSRVSYYQIPWPGPGGWLDQELAYLFWKELTSKADWEPGPALELSKYYYIKEHGGNASALGFMSKKDILDYNLLGDPAIRVWTSEPQRLNISYKRLRAGAANEVIVRNAEGEPVAKVLVAMYNADTGNLLAYGYTNSSGITALNVPPLQRDTEVYIVARKDGYAYVFRTAYVAYIGAPPIIDLSSPSNETIYGAVIPVLAHVTDPDGNVTEVNVTVEGPGLNLTKTYAPRKAKFVVNLTVRVNESGVYTVTVSAVDNDGNHVAVKRVFIADVTPPRVVVEGVSNASATNRAGGVIHVEVEDASGVEYVEVILDGKVIAREWNLGRNVKFNVTIPSDEGPHALLIVAEDVAHNVAHEVILFYVDLTPPSISVYPTINDSVINQRVVRNLIITCNDNYRVAYVVVYVDGKPLLNVSRYELKSINLSKLSDGPHNVTIIAFDTAGNSKHTTLLFYADSTPPSVGLAGVAPGAYINKSSLTVQAMVRDNAGLKYVKILLNGETLLEKTFTKGNVSAYREALHGTTNVDLKLTLSLSNGRYVLDVITADLAGNTVFKNTTFYVDTAPPKVEVLRPRNGAYVNTTDVSISVSATDNMCLASVIAYVNDSPVKLVNGVGKYKAPGEGDYVLKVSAKDCAGNKASINEVFHVDLTPPSVTLIKPRAGAVIRAPFQLSARVKDNYGVRLIYVAVDGKVIKKLNPSQHLARYWVNVSIADLPEGPHRIAVIAEDVAGNIGEGSITLIVDNTPPTIYYVNGTKSFTEGSLRLVFRVSEPVSVFEASVDGHLVKVFRAGNYEWVVKLSDLRPGRHNVTVIAKDLAGNVGMLKLTISISHAYVLEAVAVMLGLVAVAVIALYLRRRLSS